MLKEADDFHSTMLPYRNTPSQGHTYSPAQFMLLRRTRTTPPTTDRLLTPTMLTFRIVEKEISKKRCDSKTYYDKSASVEQGPLIIGTYAYAKPPPHQRGKPWIYGEVINHENPRSVLHNPHCSRPHDSKEQSPTKACSPHLPVTITVQKSKQAPVAQTFTRNRQWKLQSKHSPVNTLQPSPSLRLLGPSFLRAQSVRKSLTPHQLTHRPLTHPLRTKHQTLHHHTSGNWQDQKSRRPDLDG